MLPVFNLSGKFDANIFNLSMTNIWLFYYLLIWLRNVFPPILVSFLGVWPLNVVGYCREPKRHILGRTHAFWHIDRVDRSRNATWEHTEESKKRKNKRKETRRCDKLSNSVKYRKIRAITPFMVTNVGTNRKPICDFLLAINTNWHPISYYFKFIADYCLNFGQFVF